MAMVFGVTIGRRLIAGVVGGKVADPWEVAVAARVFQASPQSANPQRNQNRHQGDEKYYSAHDPEYLNNGLRLSPALGKRFLGGKK
jgi:hypothetical protein